MEDKGKRIVTPENEVERQGDKGRRTQQQKAHCVLNPAQRVIVIGRIG